MVSSREIKMMARDLGFEKVGIARAQALEPERSRLIDWLNKGSHGNMAWLEREPDKRTDPRILLPGAKSVIVCLLNYYTENTHNDGSAGKISRYAWGDDYHDVLREKLKVLLQGITQKEPTAGAKICIDTAPFMDKAWAVRSGLGWIGRHSNLITKELGSWVFIGSIILDIELEYDTDPVDDHCGTCTACIDACPTNAITSPYVVDSTRCISYATIELRDEELPAELSDNLNGWIYGCDICQEVCPWNRFEKPSAEARFEPRLGQTSLDLEMIRSMEHTEYLERFRRSAIKRTKLAGLKRNAKALAARMAKSDNS